MAVGVVRKIWEFQSALRAMLKRSKPTVHTCGDMNWFVERAVTEEECELAIVFALLDIVDVINAMKVDGLLQIGNVLLSSHGLDNLTFLGDDQLQLEKRRELGCRRSEWG